MLVKIKKNIAGGYGLGDLDNGKKILIKKTLAGDVVDARVYKDRGDYLIGIAEKIINKSPMRIDSPCQYFEKCGGCDLQNCSYQSQLDIKNSIIKETLGRNRINIMAEKIIPGSDKVFFYRNSIRFMFVTDKENKIDIARHAYPDDKKLVVIDKCLLQSELSNKIAGDLLGYINTNIVEKKSFWQLKIREGKRTNEIMIEIITSGDDLPGEKGIVEVLKKTDGVKSIYHTIAPGKSLINLKRRLIFGSPVIYEKIGSFSFQISPESFFQTNSEGVKNLYDTIKNYANVGISDEIIDLYCGTGTISIYLSTLAKSVTGIEVVPESIRDANGNAKINKIHNVEFICEKVEKVKINRTKNPIIIVDPPRAGLQKSILEKIISTNFKSLVYVSCNPATFARDLKIFQDCGIQVTKIQPIDMFPQTHHIEMVGLLKK